MKMLAPVIWLPSPRPIHWVPEGALSWKKMVLPLPEAVDDGMLTWYESPFVEYEAN